MTLSAQSSTEEKLPGRSPEGRQQYPIHPLVWFTILLVSGLAIYASGLKAPYYSDDYGFYLAPFTTGPLHWFIRGNPGAPHGYRPLEATLLSGIQQVAGLNPVPVHLVGVILHVFLAWLIYPIMIRLRFTPLQAAFGSGFMLITQAAVHAVLSIDTLSQVLSAIFGVLSIWLLYRHLGGGALPSETYEASHPPKNGAIYLLSIVMFGLAMLSKETSLGFFLMVAAILFVRKADWGRNKRELLTSIGMSLPYLILIIVYLGVRHQIGLARPNLDAEQDYGFDPFNVINIAKNLISFGLSMIVPASSVQTYVALQERDWITLGWIGLGTLLFLGIVLYGISKLDPSRRRGLGFLLLLGIMSLFPAMILNHVSELYAYNSLPFLAVIVGAGLGQLLGNNREGINHNWRAGIIGTLLLLGISHIAAIQSKAALMNRNGQMATHYIREIVPHADEIPQNGRLYLLKPENQDLKYSVFKLNDFDVLEFGAIDWIPYAMNRTDIKASIITSEELEQSQSGPGAYILTTQGQGKEVVRFIEGKS